MTYSLANSANIDVHCQSYNQFVLALAGDIILSLAQKQEQGATTVLFLAQKHNGDPKWDTCI